MILDDFSTHSSEYYGSPVRQYERDPSRPRKNSNLGQESSSDGVSAKKDDGARGAITRIAAMLSVSSAQQQQAEFINAVPK